MVGLSAVLLEVGAQPVEAEPHPLEVNFNSDELTQPFLFNLEPLLPIPLDDSLNRLGKRSAEPEPFGRGFGGWGGRGWGGWGGRGWGRGWGGFLG